MAKYVIKKADKIFANGYFMFVWTVITFYALFQLIPNGLSASSDFLVWMSVLSIPLIVWVDLRIIVAMVKKIANQMEDDKNEKA